METPLMVEPIDVGEQPEMKEDQTGTKLMALSMMVILAIACYIVIDILVNVVTM